MGSSLSKIRDDEEEAQWFRDKEWLKSEANKIQNLNPMSTEFRDFKWMLANKDRILGNRRIIELLR